MVVGALRGEGHSGVELVGRRGESAELVRLLRARTRLIAVTGRPGVGKSALLAHLVTSRGVAEELVPVDLTGAPTGTGMLDEVALRLGTHARGEAGAPAIRRIATVLGERPTVLVVDNAETCTVDQRLIGEMLDTCPRVSVVLARRRRISAVTDVDLAPFDVPAPGATFDEISRNDAVRLFVERAVRTSARFRFGPDNAEDVADVCRLVGGLPLAVELAAARVAVLTPAQIVRELRAEGGARGLEVLSRAGYLGIRDALAATCAALSPRERGLLETCAGFAGEFPFAAVVELAGADTGADESAGARGSVGDILDDLQRLVDLRLIEPRGAVAGEAVFDMLPIVRSFVREGAASDPALARRRRALLARWLDEAATDSAHARTADSAQFVRVVSKDLVLEARRLFQADAAAAAAWLVACADVLAGLPERAAVSDLLEQVIATGAVDRLEQSCRAQVWMWSSHLLAMSPDGAGLVETIMFRRERAAMLIDPDRWPYLALQLRFVTILNSVSTGDLPMAIASAVEGTRAADALANPVWSARFEVWLAAAAHSHGDVEQALAIVLRALDRAGRVQDPYAIVTATVLIHTLPEGVVPEGTPVPTLDAARALARTSGEAVLERFVLATLVSVERRAGRPRAAARWCAELLAAPHHAGWTLEVEITLVQVVLIAVALGDFATGARTLGAVRSDFDRVLRAMAPHTRPAVEQAEREIRSRLGQAHAGALIGAGTVLSIPDAAAQALRWARAHSAESDAEPTATPPVLTAREYDVLAVLAEGLTNKEIAQRLGLSVKTVMHHSVSIYRKLDVRGRAEATAYAHRSGLLAGGRPATGTIDLVTG